MTSKSTAFQTAWPRRLPTFLFLVMTIRYIPMESQAAQISITVSRLCPTNPFMHHVTWYNEKLSTAVTAVSERVKDISIVPTSNQANGPHDAANWPGHRWGGDVLFTCENTWRLDPLKRGLGIHFTVRAAFWLLKKMAMKPLGIRRDPQWYSTSHYKTAALIAFV